MIDVYATCAPTYGRSPGEVSRAMMKTAARAEAASLAGLLIFTDNSSFDPWLAAQHILERTVSLAPLVAVQPIYMHPYTTARMLTSLASLHGRRIDLNLVTGGYRPDLEALAGFIPHRERYDRLVEYGSMVSSLIRASGPLTRKGEHFELRKARLYPQLPDGLEPRIFLGGSSEDAHNAATALECTRLTYPRAVEEYADNPSALAGVGIRVGIIARNDSEEAWQIAHRRYPGNSSAEREHEAARNDVDSQWHRKLWNDSSRTKEPRDAYWLHPFRTTREFCPFLVGSHVEVGEALARYLERGVSTLILNCPRSDDDVPHALRALEHAQQMMVGDMR